MKHSRHPFLWRAEIVRTALLLSTAVVCSATTANAAKPKPGPAIEAPSVAIPVVAPTVDFSSPAMPTLSLPTLGPVMPAVQHEAPQLSATRRSHELKVAEHQRNRATRTSHPDRIDYVDALIHLERYDEAIDELMAIEERYPEAYINAHLMGIASERSGNVQAARRWFQAAVTRDPEAQEGTGWLRVAMIEAQLALQENPAWLGKHSVLDGYAGQSEEDLIHAVEVQVNQRREFFAEHDPVLADLYFQIGARMQSSEARDKYFVLSMETNPLRQQDIEGQFVIRAQGSAPASAH